jgi:hypothetical protein
MHTPSIFPGAHAFFPETRGQRLVSTRGVGVDDFFVAGHRGATHGLEGGRALQLLQKGSVVGRCPDGDHRGPRGRGPMNQIEQFAKPFRHFA